jgi:hypothetical protein
MGYSCSAAVNLTINDVDSQDLDWKKSKIISETLEYLRNNITNLKKEYNDCCFFVDMEVYSSMCNDNKKVLLDHPLLGKIVPYKGEYKLEDYLFESDNYIYDPEEVLQLLVLCFYLSKKMPSDKIFLGLGDVGLFWLNLELKDGEIKDINFESDDDRDEESWGFRCGELEMRQFFLSQNSLWMEANKVDSNLIAEYYHKNCAELFYSAIEDDPELIEYADDSIKKDRDFVMKLLKEDGYIFEFVDESFRSDREVALIALKSSPYEYTYLSEDLKNDKELVMLAIKFDDYAEFFIDIVKKFPCDKTIVKKALEMDAYAYEFVCPELKKDKEIMDIVASQDSDLLEDYEGFE